MKEAAGGISRRVRQIVGQPARMSYKSAECCGGRRNASVAAMALSSACAPASCVVVRDKISRPGSNGMFASLAHNRLP